MFLIMLAQCVPEEIDLPQSLSPLTAALQNQAGDCCLGSCTKNQWEHVDVFYLKKSTDEPQEGHTTSIPDPCKGVTLVFPEMARNRTDSKSQ